MDHWQKVCQVPLPALDSVLMTLNRLLEIPHMRRIRIASKGLAVAPSRFLDSSDAWTDALIKLSNLGRKMGKQVCLHTHINHVNEINWITRMAAQKLFENGVIVRNQSVLLKGVNNSEEALFNLIKTLADVNIQPVSVTFSTLLFPTPYRACGT